MTSMMTLIRRNVHEAVLEDGRKEVHRFEGIKLQTQPDMVWKTVARGDKDFTRYLDGSFSETHRALPVRSLNVGTSSEEITFEIISVGDVRAPSLVQTYWLLARPQSLILSAGPMLVTWLFVICQNFSWNHLIAVTSFLGVLFFHVAANLFNDYGDHLKGRDRLRMRGGSRVIQNGWITAQSVRRLAWSAIFVALLLGLPALLARPTEKDYQSALIAGFAGLVGIEFAFQRLGLKYRGWAEVLAFVLTGPLLTSAFAIAISGRVNWAEVVLGGVFGSLSLNYFHAVNFENIMADSQAGVRTWATRAGFDASKRFFYFTAFLSTLFLFIFSIFFARSLLFAGVALLHGLGLLIISIRVANLASPLASRLNGLRRFVLWSAWMCTVMLLIALYSDVLLGTFVGLVFGSTG